MLTTAFFSETFRPPQRLLSLKNFNLGGLNCGGHYNEPKRKYLERSRQSLQRIHSLLEESDAAEIEYNERLGKKITKLLLQDIIDRYSLKTTPDDYIFNQDDSHHATLSMEELVGDIYCRERDLQRLNQCFDRKRMPPIIHRHIYNLARSCFTDMGGDTERPSQGSEKSQALLATLFKQDPERFQAFRQDLVTAFLSQKVENFEREYRLPYKLIPATTVSNPLLAEVTRGARRRLTSVHFKTYEQLVKTTADGLLCGKYGESPRMRPDLAKLHAAIAVGLVMSESSEKAVTLEEFLDFLYRTKQDDEQALRIMERLKQPLIERMQAALKTPAPEKRDTLSFWSTPQQRVEFPESDPESDQSSKSSPRQ